MDEQRVYALTSKGNAELTGASTSLTAPELLKAVKTVLGMPKGAGGARADHP